MKKGRKNLNDEYVLNVMMTNQTQPGENIGIKTVPPPPINPTCQVGDRTSARATTICVVDLFP